MKSIKLRFERDSVRKQLLNKNSTSTDAFGAVISWADPNKGRSRKKNKDQGEEFEVETSFPDNDVDALDELVSRCSELGIECFEIKE